MEIKDSLRKEYTVIIPVAGRKSAKVTFPYEVVDREARKRNLTIKQFLEQYVAIAQYDNFDGVLYTFEPVKE